jgi:hypothetical protein
MSTHWCVTDVAAAIDRDVVTTPAHPGGGLS